MEEFDRPPVGEVAVAARVLRSQDREQGSTFATPWAILALLNIQPKLTDKTALTEVSNRVREAVDWLLDTRQPRKLWSLYPQGTTFGAQRTSLSNSGLCVFALHQALRAEFGLISKEVTTRWKTLITKADRDLLRALRAGIAPDEAEAFNDQLATTDGGLQTERVQLLVLPWLVMGTVEAYPSGNLRERMNAIRFFNDFAGRLDDIDNQLRKTESEWRIPEMLMAVRYWSDDSYLRGTAAVGHGGDVSRRTPPTAKRGTFQLDVSGSPIS